jgi:hypothetical protein
MPVRSIIKRIPLAERAYALVQDIRVKAVFEHAYRHNIWAGRESRSGVGSGLSATRALRAELPSLIRYLHVTSLLDIPCGDFQWMRRVELGAVHYIGADIVPDLIAANQREHSSELREFRVLDLTADELPTVELVLCRDCLVHLSFKLLWRALANVKRSGARYLLTTTHPGQKKNLDVRTGAWRPVNLNAPPFDFPPPVRLINEGSCEGYPDKSIGLWAVEDIPVKRLR